MTKAQRKLWAEESEDKDYQAAGDYLGLIMLPDTAREVVQALQAAAVEHHMARDLLRASRLPLPSIDDVHVARTIKKIKHHAPLAPVLLVRGESRQWDRPLIVGDGYHRICASTYVDEDAEIPCRIADLPQIQPVGT